MQEITYFLTEPFVTLGKTQITLMLVLSAVMFVVGLWWIAGTAERFALRSAKRLGDEPNTIATVHLLARLLRYGVWAIGVLIGLNQIGFDMSSLALLGGAVGVGLGFGLQTIFSNFFSGLILMFERSLKVGDYIELPSGVLGHVKEVGLRYTHITTNDRRDILVPNSEFINGQVINWTLNDATRRLRLPFGVAYGTSKDEVKAACIAAASKVTGVMVSPDKAPTAWLVGYGDSALNFEMVVWADRRATTAPNATLAAMMWALDDELMARNIEIPFPQRDLRIREGVLNVAVHAPNKPDETDSQAA